VVLAFRRGNDGERVLIKALERGEIGGGDLDHAIGLMTKHRALEDTRSAAPSITAPWRSTRWRCSASPMKTALEQVVAFAWHGRIKKSLML
jgi:octaprenyl-diphosphate synthase